MTSASTGSESTGDSFARGTALASRAFTIASDGTVTCCAPLSDLHSCAQHRETARCPKFEKYVQKLRKRLRDGVKWRGGDVWKVAPVSASVAALVTKQAVAAIFPTWDAANV